MAGASRCNVPARVQRAEGFVEALRAFNRAADGAARRPCPTATAKAKYL